MASNPRELFREVLDETTDPLAAIRAVREVFGLSVAQAKEIWLQATGQAGTLSEHQEKFAAALPRIICPQCQSDAAIVRKLQTLPTGLGYINVDAAPTAGSDFVNGFWCAACQLGFVPDQLLNELGLTSVRPI